MLTNKNLLIGTGIALAAALVFAKRAKAAAPASSVGNSPSSIKVGEPAYTARKTDVDATLAGAFFQPGWY